MVGCSYLYRLFDIRCTAEVLLPRFQRSESRLSCALGLLRILHITLWGWILDLLRVPDNVVGTSGLVFVGLAGLHTLLETGTRRGAIHALADLGFAELCR